MGKVTFGTGGFRAVIGEDFNKDNVIKIAAAICDEIEREELVKKVCVGYDNRFMSETFARWASEAFASRGVSVIFLDKSVPTPVVMFVAQKLGLDYSIAITASHNPYNYNGVKVFYKAQDAGIETTKVLEDIIEKMSLPTLMEFEKGVESGLIEVANYDREYLDSIYDSFIDVNKIRSYNLKVAFDAMYGSGINTLKMLMEDFNLNGELLNYYRDAFFGFALPAPNSETTVKLTETVINNGYDIGFAIDGDGDRLAIVDSKGNFIDNNWIMACLYYYYHKKQNKKGDIVKSICTLNILDKLATAFNANCHEVDVGFKNVSRCMNETGAILGGESSGGLAMPGHIAGKDSIFAICLVINMLCDMEMSIEEIIALVIKEVNGYNTKILEKAYRYPENRKEEILNTLLVDKKLPLFNKEVKSVWREKFVKVYFTDDTWTTIRFSGTEPMLRIIAEVNEGEGEEEVCVPFLEMLSL